MNSHKHIRTASYVLVLFYLVGIAGLSFPATIPLFQRLIPVALLLSAALLVLFHPSGMDKKTAVVFTGIFIAGFLAEMAGVATGIIFGDYRYGEGLGFKIAGTPVIIGLTWLLLVYTTSGVAEALRLRPVPSVLASSGAMLLYDFILEKVAAPLDMWYWGSGNAPFRNYLAWFVIALVFQTVVKLTGIKTINRISPVVYTCQFLFLLVMLLIYTFQA